MPDANVVTSGGKQFCFHLVFKQVKSLDCQFVIKLEMLARSHGFRISCLGKSYIVTLSLVSCHVSKRNALYSYISWLNKPLRLMVSV